MDDGRNAVQSVPGHLLCERCFFFAEHGLHHIESVCIHFVEFIHLVTLFLNLIDLIIRYILIAYNSLYSRIYRPFSIGAQLIFIWMFSFGIMVSKYETMKNITLLKIYILYTASASLWYLGNRWLGRTDILVHDPQKGWTFDQEISVLHRILFAMRRHHLLILMHLLDGATTTH